MSISDQLLAAYVDGELSPEQKGALDRAVAADPVMAERLAAHRHLREEITSAFAGVVDEPVPDRLLRAAMASSEAASNLVSFRARPRLAPPRWAWMSGGALAAGLAAGLLIAPTIQAPGGSSLIDAHMSARGALIEALATQLASDQAGRPVQVGISFRAIDGRMCRTFEVRRAGAIAGLACHQGGPHWSVRMAVPTEAAQTGAYATAGSRLPTPVADLAQSLAAAPPLNAADEAKARASGWR